MSKKGETMSSDETSEAAPLTATSPYTPVFRHTDWPNGQLNADLPTGNSPNDVMHRLQQEFGLIQTAFTKTSEVGMIVVTSISPGSSIPIPAGFTKAETNFFAFVKAYSARVDETTTTVGFSAFADSDGVVRATPFGAGGLTVSAVAIARRGGW